MSAKRLNAAFLRRRLLGGSQKGGLLPRIVMYLFIIGIGYIFLSPLISLLSTSFKSLKDLSNPLVVWIPSALNLENYRRAWTIMGKTSVLFQSVGMFLIVCAAQTASSAVIGYGFAKYKFAGRRLLFGLMVAVFIIPEQVTMMPRYLMFKDYGMLGSIMPMLSTALTGVGLRSSIFILIFYQFFRMAPKSLDEAALVDGAGFLRVFAAINIPMVTPAIVIVLVFSFVWHWNETYLADMYFGTVLKTFPLQLEKFETLFAQMYPPNDPMLRFTQSVNAAGTLVCIAPLLVLYALVENKLIASLDRTGITGE